MANLLSEENAGDTLKRADSAMYASKEAGRNCIHFHDGKVVSDWTPIRNSVLPPAGIQPQVHSAS